MGDSGEYRGLGKSGRKSGGKGYLDSGRGGGIECKYRTYLI